MEKFYCENCKEIFEAKGKKKKWESSIFGKCWKLVADCPNCKKECGEWRITSSKKESCGKTCSRCSGCV